MMSFPGADVGREVDEDGSTMMGDDSVGAYRGVFPCAEQG